MRSIRSIWASGADPRSITNCRDTNLEGGPVSVVLGAHDIPAEVPTRLEMTRDAVAVVA